MEEKAFARHLHIGHDNRCFHGRHKGTNHNQAGVVFVGEAEKQFFLRGVRGHAAETTRGAASMRPCGNIGRIYYMSLHKMTCSMPTYCFRRGEKRRGKERISNPGARACSPHSQPLARRNRSQSSGWRRSAGCCSERDIAQTGVAAPSTA